jgi:hypothetical protein
VNCGNHGTVMSIPPKSRSRLIASQPTVA